MNKRNMGKYKEYFKLLECKIKKNIKVNIDINRYSRFLATWNFLEKSMKIKMNQEKQKNDDLKIRISFGYVEFKINLLEVKININLFG